MRNRARVLFVDDESHIVETLKSLFKSTYDVYTATNGNDALDIIRANHIHVIVSDQRMPEMQGVDLLRAVKKISPKTMRLMLTGYADLAAIIGSINSGEIFRYIYKPWNNTDLKNTVNVAAAVGLKMDSTEVDVPINEIDEQHLKSGVSNGSASNARLGILVIDDEQLTYATIKELFANKYTVVYAPNYEKALDILETQTIAVVVSEVFVNKQDITQLVKLLKAEYPQIVTVILTTFNDADMAVSLINQGQIFRYLSKPIHKAQLRASLEISVIYHNKCKAQPVLLSRHQVEKVPVNPGATMASSIMSRLKSLRNSINLH